MTAPWIDRLESALAARPVRRLRVAGTEARAAVLVALLTASDDVSLLIEERAHGLARHAGQLALPGGRIDDHDGTAERAALREAEEETGLSRDVVRTLGRLPDRRTPTGWVITPVVGVATAPGLLAPAATEVASLIRVPVCAMFGPDGFRPVRRRERGLMITGPALCWNGWEVWGATARVLLSLRGVMAAVDGPWSRRPTGINRPVRA